MIYDSTFLQGEKFDNLVKSDLEQSYSSAILLRA